MVYYGRWRQVPVAVKLIVSATQSDLLLAAREALLAKLASHPNLVQTFAVGCFQLTAAHFEGLNQLAAKEESTLALLDASQVSACGSAGHLSLGSAFHGGLHGGSMNNDFHGSRGGGQVAGSPLNTSLSTSRAGPGTRDVGSGSFEEPAARALRRGHYSAAEVLHLLRASPGQYLTQVGVAAWVRTAADVCGSCHAVAPPPQPNSHTHMLRTHVQAACTDLLSLALPPSLPGQVVMEYADADSLMTAIKRGDYQPAHSRWWLRALLATAVEVALGRWCAGEATASEAGRQHMVATGARAACCCHRTGSRGPSPNHPQPPPHTHTHCAAGTKKVHAGAQLAAMWPLWRPWQPLHGLAPSYQEAGTLMRVDAGMGHLHDQGVVHGE